MFPDHEPIFTTLADRARFPPWGLFGGEDGRPARYLTATGGEVSPIPSKGTAPVAGGTMIRVETCVGGTTAKVGLILDGRPRVTKEYEVGAQANPGVGQARASG